MRPLRRPRLCRAAQPEWDEAAYGRRFARVKDYIAAGDIYQANLSFRARFAFLGDALALYEQLRAAKRRATLRLYR